MNITADCENLTSWDGSICTNYALTYDANGGTGSVPTTPDLTYELNATVPVASGTGLTAPSVNMEFNGWNTDALGTGTSYNADNIDTADDIFTFTADTILYAQWILKTPTLTVTPTGSGTITSIVGGLVDNFINCP